MLEFGNKKLKLKNLSINWNQHFPRSDQVYIKTAYTFQTWRYIIEFA